MVIVAEWIGFLIVAFYVGWFVLYVMSKL